MTAAARCLVGAACGGRAPERGGGVTLCGAVGGGWLHVVCLTLRGVCRGVLRAAACGECDAATLCGECAAVLACTGVAGAGGVADA